jgi:hypothetical protein
LNVANPVSWHNPLSTEAGRRRFFGDFVKFKFAKQPDVPVVFSEKFAARIFKTRQDSQHGFSV